MFSSIVRVMVPDEDLYGTGVILAEHVVLTSEHVVNKDSNVSILWNNNKYTGNVTYKDKYIALIYIDNLSFVSQFTTSDEYLFFSVDEEWSSISDWRVEGYITDQQLGHTVNGRGVFSDNSEYENSDSRLGTIESGITNNYKGLSGAPVIYNGRAIGILQIQQWDPRGELGLYFASINLFLEQLPAFAVRESRYLEELRQTCKLECERQITKNKDSAKYIPDIFIEENQYKDNLRYFAEPFLFINKLIDEVKLLDFQSVNKVLEKQKKIDFQGYPEHVEVSDVNRIVEQFTSDLSFAIATVKKFEGNHKTDGMTTEELYTSGQMFYSSLKWDLQDIMDQLQFCKYRKVLITRGAGQGKTNFLCDYTENYLLRKNIISIYFNAYDFCERPIDAIVRKLTCSGKYDVQYIKNVLGRRLERTGQSVIVIIDGLNENTTLNNFGKYMEETLRELSNYTFVKVVMSSRDELLQERFGSLTRTVIGPDFYIMDMSVRDTGFKNRIFEGYLSFYNVEILRSTLYERTYELLASDTLLLRFFCEVNEDKKQIYMYDIYMYALFEKYFEKKKKEMADKGIAGGETLYVRLINRICQYMVDNRIFSQIPKSVLNDAEIQILDKILETDVIFTEDYKIKKGFTDEITQVLSFTFDEFRDFCITKYLISRDDAETSFPEIWGKMCSENWIILEGIQKYVFFLAKSKYRTMLSIIKRHSNYEHIYWDNVWSLDEEDITNEDVSAWKKQYESEGEYCSELTHYLLTRRDRSYFKKVSIELLFDILEELAFDLTKYDALTRLLFSATKKDKYNQIIRQDGVVLPCDNLIENLNKAMDARIDYDFEDFLRISIFSFEILPDETVKMWINAYAKVKDIVMQIFNTYYEKDIAPIIEQNILEIISALKERYHTTELSELQSKFTHDQEYNDVNNHLLAIWG